METGNPLEAAPDEAKIAEARNLCRSLIQADPNVSFGEVRETADRLGLRVSRPMYMEIHRELAGTVRGAMVALEEGEDAPGEAGSPPFEATDLRPRPPEAARRTPVGEMTSLDFMVALLKERPAATYEEVREAAERAGHTVFPITYGHAWHLAGLSGRKAGAPVPAKRQGNPTMEFLVSFVKEHPEATYQEVREAAEAEGLQVFPVTYGIARRQAGLPRLTGQAKPGASARRRGRPRKAEPQAPPARPPRGQDTVEDLVDMVRRLQHHRTELRETLLQIEALARECLSRTR